MKKDMVVQKFGGSSVASPEKIRNVAQFIKKSLATHDRICVVVSAMGHSTNELINLATQIHPHPPKREMDMLISCGERSSMALLAMALDNINVKAISLTGSQSGIITDENHSGAEIKAIRPNRVFEAFREHKVVIIAGFQGISRNKEITTLKRGGSDTTAVAMAAALGAKLCEIYTDVPGVMDIDPKVQKYARPLPKLSHEQMCSMSLYGAKVLAHDAAVIAKELNVDLLIAESGTSEGTLISEKIIRKAPRLVSAISHLRGVLRIAMDSNQSPAEQAYFLCGGIKEGKLVGYASNDIAQELPTGSSTSRGLALITLQLGDRAFLLKTMSLVSAVLSRQNVILVDAIIGFNEVFLVISDEDLNNALMCLHDALMQEVQS